MAIIQNPNQTRNRNSGLKQADAFVNLSVPGSDNQPMKIGALALHSDRPRDQQLIEFFKANPEAAAEWLADNIMVSYQDARQSELALPTLGTAQEAKAS